MSPSRPRAIATASPGGAEEGSSTGIPPAARTTSRYASAAACAAYVRPWRGRKTVSVVSPIRGFVMGGASIDGGDPRHKKPGLRGGGEGRGALRGRRMQRTRRGLSQGALRVQRVQRILSQRHGGRIQEPRCAGGVHSDTRPRVRTPREVRPRPLGSYRMRTSADMPPARIHAAVSGRIPVFPSVPLWEPPPCPLYPPWPRRTPERVRIPWPGTPLPNRERAPIFAGHETDPGR